MSDLVSIMVPAYNIESWIGRCLESLRDQTYKNIEVIVVDDGSRDRTGELCDAFAQADGRFRVVHQENQGAAEARNRGLERAEGRYICFVDGDDHVSSAYVEQLYCALQKDQAQLSVCGYWEEEETGALKRQLSTEEKQMSARETLGAIFFCDEIGRSLWNKMFDKMVIQKHQLRFSSKYLVGEDMVFLIRYLQAIESVHVSDSAAYYYLWRTGSAMQKRYWDEAYDRNRRSWLEALETAGELLQKEGAVCRKNFEVYKTLVYYRILCESAALKGESKSKRELEKNLKHSVRKRAAYAISSGRLPAETSLGLFLACISPRIQKMAANVRRA